MEGFFGFVSSLIVPLPASATWNWTIATVCVFLALLLPFWIAESKTGSRKTGFIAALLLAIPCFFLLWYVFLGLALLFNLLKANGLVFGVIFGVAVIVFVVVFFLKGSKKR